MNSRRRLTIALAGLGLLFVLAFVAYVLVIAVDGAPIEAFRNGGRGMEPTLLADEWITMSRRPTRVYRGELVVHIWPEDPSMKFLKRIVGMPGDTLAMKNGILSVSNREFPEPYAWREEPTIDPAADDFRWQRAYVVGPAAGDTAHYTPSRNNWGPIVVPARNYFVLGDNRDNSLDSRYWGFLPAEDVSGEVRRVYFSRDSTGRIRWSRFGHRVQ